ncbi:MAG: hypothetical protein SAQ54_17410 [Oscillatoria sp. PMC 1050.18]|nr:hypothetical protein [Oscillatoria sp. PMC 1050.18]
MAMNKQALMEELDRAIAKDRPDSEKLFLRLLKEVWQIDWTVAPYDVYGHMIEFDIPYFLRFMRMDLGDEAEEHQLILDWIQSRTTLRDTNSRDALISLMDECNQIRIQAR